MIHSNSQKHIGVIMYYAGIGNKIEISEMMEIIIKEIGALAATSGYTLRSGHSDGADKAFEYGCDSAKGKKEIMLPWKLFNNSTSHHYSLPEEAFDIAADHFSTWRKLNDHQKKLFARNATVLLGQNLQKPVNFMICYTEDDIFNSTVSHSIRIAKDNGIPVYNLSNHSSRKLIQAIFK